jgi:hypothetical protein
MGISVVNSSAPIRAAGPDSFRSTILTNPLFPDFASRGCFFQVVLVICFDWQAFGIIHAAAANKAA